MAAHFAAKGARRVFGRRDHGDLGSVLGSIASAAIMIAAVLIASVIVFPSVEPATIISSLGIWSVAIGLRSRTSCRICWPARFVPTVMALAALLLAGAMIWLDSHHATWWMD